MNEIKKLPPAALFALSDYLAALAADARAVARAKDRRAERRALLARKAAIADAARAVERYAAHMSLERAIETVALETCLPLETVAFSVSKAQRKRAIRDRFARDRRIVALARAGLTNTEIAAKVNLHPGTVGRIVRAGLDGGRGA